MLPIERERRQRLRRQARQLADSGLYIGWQEIEKALVEKSGKFVPEAMAGTMRRALLDARCAYARRRSERARLRGD